MNSTDEDLEKLRSRLRYKVSYDLGFACADMDDVVQESLMRYLAPRAEKRSKTRALRAHF